MAAMEQTWTCDKGLRVEFRAEVLCFTTTPPPRGGGWVLGATNVLLKPVGEGEAAAALSVLSQMKWSGFLCSVSCRT